MSVVPSLWEEKVLVGASPRVSLFFISLVEFPASRGMGISDGLPSQAGSAGRLHCPVPGLPTPLD